MSLGHGFGPRIVWGDLDLTAAPFMVEFDYDLGNGVTLYDEIESLFRDGTIPSSTSTGNATYTLPILIEREDSQLRSRSAALLAAEADKPFNTLTIHPSDGYGPAMVLETFPAQLTHDWDQRLEEANLRRFVATGPRLPFARSVESTSFTWNSVGTQLDPLTSTTGWTTVAGGPVSTTTGFDGDPAFALTNGATVRKTLGPLRDFLWVCVRGSQAPSGPTQWALRSVKFDGTTVFNALTMAAGAFVDTTDHNTPVQYFIVPTGAFSGRSVEVTLEITHGGMVTAQLFGLWTVDYPGATYAEDDAVQHPRGIDIVEVGGTARAPADIRFTAPAGGAFVYTAPDPAAALRGRGSPELIFSHFTVASADGVALTRGATTMWFPQGTHSVQIGRTAGQPLALNPDGVYPEFSTQASEYGYPADLLAAVSYFDTSGDKALISADPVLPQGYHDDAVVHENHVLHPGRCGFAVLDENGDAIPTTVTYFKRWKHHAAE